MKRYWKDLGCKDPYLEVKLQMIASDHDIAPKVIDTDYRTFVEMEHLDELCIADKYGENINNIPTDIQEQILDILWMLYNECGILYLDVTPYNFIEKDGKVYVIDFGDAKQGGELNEYLQDLFDTWKLKWNEDFR
jgi:RIO-like serine/threonine protein kinase